MRSALVLVALAAVAACRPPGYGKGGGGGDDAPEVDAAVVTPDASPDAAATCTKGFRLEGHADASSVLITGSFVEWAGTSPPAIAMAKGGDGVWTGTVDVTAGAHQYKFIVDGTWIMDPANPDQMDDGFGGKNSVITCAP